MDYVTVRELRDKSGEIWARVDAGEEFVVTRNGKPVALLVHTAPADVEQRLRALRAAQLGSVVARLQAQASARGSDQLSDEAVQVEIDAVRRGRRPAAAVAAEPAAVYAASPASGRARRR